MASTLKNNEGFNFSTAETLHWKQFSPRNIVNCTLSTSKEENNLKYAFVVYCDYEMTNLIK